jgi:hypothetical protein
MQEVISRRRRNKNWAYRRSTRIRKVKSLGYSINKERKETRRTQKNDELLLDS